MGSSPAANMFLLRFAVRYGVQWSSGMRCDRYGQASSSGGFGASQSLWEGMGGMGCDYSVEVASGRILTLTIKDLEYKVVEIDWLCYIGHDIPLHALGELCLARSRISDWDGRTTDQLL